MNRFWIIYKALKENQEKNFCQFCINKNQCKTHMMEIFNTTIIINNQLNILEKRGVRII